jgi:penicillin amidase
LNANEINELFPDYPKDGPVALNKLADLTRDLPVDGMLMALPGAAGPPRASNNWVVDGAHSVTGKPLLANDPHLDYAAPLIWYLARLEAPNLTLAGGMVDGAPLMVLSHNGRIAWVDTTPDAARHGR